MAEANTKIAGEDINPFKPQIGETLPFNVERNYNGFLVRKHAIKFRVDSKTLLTYIAILKDQLLIAKFIRPKPATHALDL